MINYNKHWEEFPSVCFFLSIYYTRLSKKKKKSWFCIKEAIKAGGNTGKCQLARGQCEDQWFCVASAWKSTNVCEVAVPAGDFHTWKCIEIFHSVAWCSHLQIHPTHSPWVLPLLCGVRQLLLWLWVLLHSTFSGWRMFYFLIFELSGRQFFCLKEVGTTWWMKERLVCRYHGWFVQQSVGWHSFSLPAKCMQGHRYSKSLVQFVREHWAYGNIAITTQTLTGLKNTCLNVWLIQEPTLTTSGGDFTSST